MEEQTLFYRILPTTDGGPIKVASILLPLIIAMITRIIIKMMRKVI